jgi:hypothetical protein
VADELLHVQPERHQVVRVARSRRPRQRLAREQGCHVIEVTHPGDCQRLVEQDQPGLVRKKLAYGDPGFAVLRELGPVARYG